MHSTFDSVDANEAIGAVAKVVNRHTTVPILSSVLLRANGDGRIHVRGTDLTTTIERSFEANTRDEGEVAMPGRTLSQYLASAPPGLTILEGGVRSSTITTLAGVAKFETQEAEEFPPRSAPGDALVSLPGKELLAAIRAVWFAVSTEEHRGIVLQHVLFQFKEGVLTLIATDGYRLAHYRTGMSCGDQSLGLCIDRDSLQHVIGNFADCDTIELRYGRERVDFIAPERRITSLVCGGQFPDCQRILADASKTRCTIRVDRLTLLKAVRRAEIFTSDVYSMISLSCVDSNLTITCQSEIHGSTIEHLHVAHDDDDMKVALNGRYLMDILKAIETEMVTVGLSNPLSPAKINPLREGGEDQTYLLMPLRA